MLDISDHQLIKELTALCQQVSAVILSYYNGHCGIEVTQKSNHTPLTNADLAAHDLLSSGLKSIINIPVISEESEDYSAVVHLQDYWLIDPIDGTTSFIQHSDEFCILIARIQNRRPTLSLIYLPITHQFWFAKLGYGAWKGNQTSEIIPIKSSGKHHPIHIILPHTHVSKRMNHYLYEHFAQQTRSYLSSGIKFCRIAEGIADFYPKLSTTTCEWDTAAGDLLVNEAGGNMLFLDGNKPTYGHKTDPSNQPFLVYGHGFSQQEIAGYLQSMRHLLS